MKRRILRVMLAAFSTWMRREMEPAGRAAFHLFETRAEAIIDDLGGEKGKDTAGSLPEVEYLQGLNADAVLSGLNWVFSTLRVAYPEDWAPVAIEIMRVVVRRNIAEIVGLAQPPTQSQSGATLAPLGGSRGAKPPAAD